MSGFFSARPRVSAVSICALLVAVSVSASASANTTDTHTSNTPSAGIMTNPCNGDTFPFTGRFQMTLHSSTDESGGTHFYLHQIELSGSGTAPSGTQYEWHGSISNMNQAIEPDTQTLTNETAGVVVGTGPTDDFLVHFVLHVTLINGQPIVQQSHGELKCVG
jgi:hypothetical protein